MGVYKHYLVESVTEIKTTPDKIWGFLLVQSLLANAEIQTFLKDEINGTLVPWVIAPGGAGSIKIIVSNLDYDKAKLIVEEYEKNKKADDLTPNQ